MYMYTYHKLSLKIHIHMVRVQDRKILRRYIDNLMKGVKHD